MTFIRGMLSRPDILEQYKLGNLVIDPFDPESVGTNSYDIRLGKWIYRERFNSGLPTFHGQVEPRFLYNMYDPDHVQSIYELEKARRASEVLYPWFQLGDLEGISPDNLVILIRPGESILAHTEEFIGSNCNFLTTRIAARSSIGRNALEIIRCAGLGDVFYHNRWTLEITNNLQYHMIPLVVGRRVGQVVFDSVTPLEEGDGGYNTNGKYQVSFDDLKEMKAKWKPENMLPKIYLDREVQR